MPTNPHHIKKGTRDPGTAQMVADVRKRLQKSEGQGTYIGRGSVATDTAMMTADISSSAVVCVQGASESIIAGVGAGMFVASSDSSSDIDVGITPLDGIVITEGVANPNQINWVDSWGGNEIANIGAEVSGANRSFGLAVFSPDRGTQLLLTLEATNGGHYTLRADVYEGITRVATNTIWTG